MSGIFFASMRCLVDWLPGSETNEEETPHGNRAVQTTQVIALHYGTQERADFRDQTFGCVSNIIERSVDQFCSQL